MVAQHLRPLRDVTVAVRLTPPWLLFQNELVHSVKAYDRPSLLLVD
jgi:hypothetical protein